MEIAILDGFALNDNGMITKAFEKIGTVHYFDRTNVHDVQEIVARIGQSDVVITNKVPMTAEILAQVPQVKYIGVTATGYNIIDLAACKKFGVTVTNIPQYSTQAVAQFTFALLLEIVSQVGLHTTLVREGEWIKSPDFTFWRKPLAELAGKTIGLIGFGAIGHEVAQLALAFHMNVIFYNHRAKVAPEGVTQVPLAELYAMADIISLHIPQFPETEKMINAKSLAQMKKSAIVINTSRGGLVDENDVAEALQKGDIAAYAADVLAVEPMQADNPLRTAPNTYITPHVAWAALETRQRLIEIAVNNLLAYQKNAPQNVVQ